MVTPSEPFGNGARDIDRQVVAVKHKGQRMFAQAKAWKFSRCGNAIGFQFKVVTVLLHVAISQVVRQRKVSTTPLLAEANKRRNTKRFTKTKPHCQRSGVRGNASQTTKPRHCEKNILGDLLGESSLMPKHQRHLGSHTIFSWGFARFVLRVWVGTVR